MRRGALRRIGLVAALAAGALLAGRAALAWWSQQHLPASAAAAALLPKDMPDFFRRGTAALAAYSADPDVWKEKVAPALRAAEGPNHYLDLELLQGRALPADRWKYEGLCREVRTSARAAGGLPYALQEWWERLLLAFAEHRAWPKDERVHAKTLYIAGVLAHYAQDAAQPLHTTVHFDGRLAPDGSSPRSGIHARVDALPEKLRLSAKEVADAAGGKLPTLGPDGVAAMIMDAIRESHGKLDLVYKLEGKLPDPDAAPPEKVDPEVRAFALERLGAGARLTAALWYSAWTASAEVKLPAWHSAYAPEPGGGGPKE